MKSQIVTENWQGVHNSDLERARGRLVKGQTYRNLSTICVVPTRGVIPAKVVQSWMGMFTPMNQKFTRIFIQGMEVGDAYSQAIEMILGNAELSQWKYILTLEEDNMPPPDGLLRLYESLEGQVDGRKYDAVGGLYWTKGEGGQPMCYGSPMEVPKNFVPQVPLPDKLTPCNGLGMGFTLFRLSMLADRNLPRPLFQTVQSYTPGVGSAAYTQDLKFFEAAGKLGYRFACDARVKVGHYELDSDIIW